MSVKNWLTGLAALLAMFIFMSIPGPLNVFAKPGVEAQPMDIVNEIVVELNDDYFNPDVITISNGESTKLLLKNVGKKEHTFTVEKLGIDVEIEPGKEKTITVKPEKTGTYELICRFHKNEGMVGKVIVE
ncbi:cupredoxin domain-containing protein [Oceanobacillus chungangensis]|uniref:Cytochrome B n=1 Tax=Oceanobacillus chungangensis TaxID=1229152 RepID=A0A3D8PX34_9BACI|nr:cupredoxin domain-containing protein [Oceanobacillus chungangensis]RDW19699.1 cytochrome B [Oceanobacillus chungangensis]